MAGRQWENLPYNLQQNLHHDNQKGFTSYAAVPINGQGTPIPQEASPSRLPTPTVLSPRAWLYEISSLGLAFAVLAALIGILAHFDHKQNPLWSTGITLNTIVSIASLLFRTSIMYSVATCISQLKWIWFYKGQRPLKDTVLFDQASRGVWGSVKILFSSAYRSMVSVGAIVTIAALAIGPLFQQSLAFYSEEDRDFSSRAYASSAFSYNGSTGDAVNMAGTQLPFNMRSSAINGLLSSGLIAAPNPPFSCPSGNCTWSPFPTLGISARCNDISERFATNCTSSSGAPNCTIAVVKEGSNTLSDTVSERLSGQLSRAFNFTKPYEDPIVLAFSSRSEFANTTLNKEAWPVMPSGMVLNMEWVRVSDLTTDEKGRQWYISADSTVEAKRCTLYTAVHDIHARVQGGVYVESLASEVLAAKEGRDEKQASSWIYEYAPSHAPPRNFSIASDQQGAMFDGTNLIIHGVNNGVGVLIIRMRGIGEYYSSGQSTMSQLGVIPELLYQLPNITDSIYSLAHYMNVAMRSNDTLLERQGRQRTNPSAQNSTNTESENDYVAPSHRVEGTVNVMQIHVAIRWGWLAMPGALTILASILLATTIFESYRYRVGIWKDSPLAMLLNSHWEPGLGRQGEGAVTAHDAARGVKGLRARFVSGREGSKDTEAKFDKRILISS